MRTIETTNQFTKDYRREARGQHGSNLDALLQAVIGPLAQDQQLAPKFKDHALGGNWKDFRDCHVKPDLVLIYQKVGKTTLRLVRLGSHSELF